MVSCKWHFMLLCNNRSCDLPTNTCLGSCCYLSLIKLVWQCLMRDGNINEVQLNDSSCSGNWKAKNGGVSDDQPTISTLLHKLNSGKLREAMERYDKAVEAYENNC